MSKSLYDYTTPQIEAMWKAYCAAPDDATVEELRSVMDDAAASVRLAGKEKQ